MRKLSIGVIDLTTKRSIRILYERILNANSAAIMPQAIARWCEEEGHNVKYVCYIGTESLIKELPENVDLVFIGAFTQAAQLAYAMSNLFRSKGAVTVIGGPHARSYPNDARKYFDYVLGFTDKAVIRDVLYDCSQHRPIGIYISAKHHPTSLPGVFERWKFIEPTLRKANFIKAVPMISSLGCPYTCSFCVDSIVPYQLLDLKMIKDDLRFLLQKFKKPIVAWHDPNFGVRLDESMDIIEDAIPPGSINFIVESSLSQLSEPRLKRLKRNGFKAVLPGIESWFDMGNKSGTGKKKGLEKVRQVSEHLNMILRYIPYVSPNFIIGLDSDEGTEPFELTKRFVDLTPGAFVTFMLNTAFGQDAPINLEYQRDNRVLPFPFHLLGNQLAMNVKPKNYSWINFYDHLIDLTDYTYSWPMILKRFRANKLGTPSLFCMVKSASSERSKLKYFIEVRRRLQSDTRFRSYFEQETTEIPKFFVDIIRKDLGPLYRWLPQKTLYHDPKAYLKSKNSC